MNEKNRITYDELYERLVQLGATQAQLNSKVIDYVIIATQDEDTYELVQKAISRVKKDLEKRDRQQKSKAMKLRDKECQLEEEKEKNAEIEKALRKNQRLFYTYNFDAKTDRFGWSKYDGKYDIVLHCSNEEEQEKARGIIRKVVERLNAGRLEE